MCCTYQQVWNWELTQYLVSLKTLKTFLSDCFKGYMGLFKMGRGRISVQNCEILEALE